MEDIRKKMQDIRRDFDFGTLDHSDIPANPFDLLKGWLNEAVTMEI